MERIVARPSNEPEPYGISLSLPIPSLSLSHPCPLFLYFIFSRRRHRMHGMTHILDAHVSRSRTQMISDCLPLLERICFLYFIFVDSRRNDVHRRREKKVVENTIIRYRVILFAQLHSQSSVYLSEMLMCIYISGHAIWESCRLTLFSKSSSYQTNIELLQCEIIPSYFDLQQLTYLC